MNPKKLWKKFRSKKSEKSTDQRPSPDSVARSSTIDHRLDHVAHATSSVALAAIGSKSPSQSHGQPSLSPSSAPTLHSTQNPPTLPDGNRSNIIGGNTSPGVRGPGFGAT